MFVDEKKWGELPVESVEAHILRQTREYLDVCGWTKGTMKNIRGQRCLLGALQHISSSYDSITRHRVWDILSRVIGIQQFSSRDVVNWNDQPGRTFAEVKAALRKAEEIA